MKAESGVRHVMRLYINIVQVYRYVLGLGARVFSNTDLHVHF